MHTIPYTYYNSEDVEEAVFKVTGLKVMYDCSDGEHEYWFLVGDWKDELTEEHDYAEDLFDLLEGHLSNNDHIEKILKYLADNAMVWGWPPGPTGMNRSVIEQWGCQLYEKLKDGEETTLRYNGYTYKLRFRGKPVGSDNYLAVTNESGEEKRFGWGWSSEQVWQALAHLERGWATRQTPPYRPYNEKAEEEGGLED